MPALNRRTGKILLVACIGACAAQMAAATDMNSLAPTPAPTQRPDWTGFYLRSNSGGGADSVWSNLNGTSAFSSPGTAHPFDENFGYNFQSGNFVFGIEGSLAAANFDGKFTAPYLPPNGAWSPNTNWLGTVTGRFGYSFGQWMPYVKGGFVTANVGSPLQDGAVTGFTQNSSEHTGWTAGAGFEYQISSKWSLGLEYLYTDLGNGGGNSIGNGGTPDVYGTALKSQSILGRLNYKTGW